jgi:hypothetical protein
MLPFSLTGKQRYTESVFPKGMAYERDRRRVVLRSPHPGEKGAITSYGKIPDVSALRWRGSSE